MRTWLIVSILAAASLVALFLFLAWLQSRRESRTDHAHRSKGGIGPTPDL